MVFDSTDRRLLSGARNGTIKVGDNLLDLLAVWHIQMKYKGLFYSKLKPLFVSKNFFSN